MQVPYPSLQGLITYSYIASLRVSVAWFKVWGQDYDAIHIRRRRGARSHAIPRPCASGEKCMLGTKLHMPPAGAAYACGAAEA